MSLRAWGLLIILAVLVVVFAANRPPEPESWSWVWIGKKLWHMPGGIGALFGAFLGLIAVALATRKGFDNLIRAQKEQAAIDREAEVDRIEWETTCLAAGLRGELKYVIFTIRSHASVLRKKAALFEDKAKDAKMAKEKIHLDIWPVPECRFYIANVSNLGLLGADITAELSFAYEKLAEWRRDVDRSEPSFIGSIYQTMPGYADILETYLPYFEDLVRRLEVIERGEPDPGISIEMPPDLPLGAPIEQPEVAPER